MFKVKNPTMMRRKLVSLLLCCTLAALLPAVRISAQDTYRAPYSEVEPTFTGEQLPSQLPTTNNRVLWQQYQALQTGTTLSDCQSCQGSGYQSCRGCGNASCDRCGCNDELFPWIDGPGNCDSWCVGPKWEVQTDALMLFREDADLDHIIASVGGTTSFVDQYDHGIGGRVFVTGYNDCGYGMQVGWEGVDQWNANITFDPVGTETRTIALKSRLNSVEINFLPYVPYNWQVFSGFRFVELADNLVDSRINDKPIPPPAAPPAAPVAVIDTSTSYLLKNQLIGFQIGGRRDAWNWGERLTIASFINAGVYCNKFRRDDVMQTDTTIITGDDIDTPEDEFSQTTSTVRTTVRTNPTDVAFLGEAGITGTWKINQCCALQSGYQILAIDGVGQAVDAFFTPGLNGDTLVYHGLQFGFEYRR